MDPISRPNASYSLTLRLRLQNAPHTLGAVMTAIADAGGDIGAVDTVSVDESTTIRDVTVNASSGEQSDAIAEAVRQSEAVEVVSVDDRTLVMHLGGKIEVKSRVPLRTREDLSMAYTPGVARICQAIADAPDRVSELTMKRNAVAVISDGSAVLGLGNIGPGAALPVMEGKAILFKEFADINAFPICLDTQDPDEIVSAVRAIAPAFGGINLEDISSPRCFDIEQRLREQLSIPVFHDDQHGTAVVVLAALQNALRVVDKSIGDVRIVVSGLGAAGVACTRMLLAAGARHVIGCDRAGAIYVGRNERMGRLKQEYAGYTNHARRTGELRDVIAGADVFLGVSGPGVLTADDVRSMADRPIVFALANPIPEIMPEETAGLAAVMATGRSDYPNQINNVLCFPGMFRGALDCRASDINEPMKLAAANAIANVISASELRADYIVPSVFDQRVVPAVARAVTLAAIRSGVARIVDVPVERHQRDGASQVGGVALLERT